MEVKLIGLGEELGLPSLKYRKQNFQTRLLDAIEDKLKEKYQVEKLNTFSYTFNKSWHIDSILNNNLSLNELEKLRRIGNKFAKKESIMMNIFSPEIKKITYPNKNINDLLRGNSVVLYDIGLNDFMYHVNNNVVAAHVLLSKNKKAREKLENEELFKQIFNNVKNNIKNILNINKNTSIYILGFSLKIYVPKRIYDLYEDKTIYNELNRYINKWNKMLKLLESKNIHFIDLDLYKNKKDVINNIISNIKIGTLTNQKANIDYKGIQGMIEDLKNDKIHLKEKSRQIKYLKEIGSVIN